MKGLAPAPRGVISLVRARAGDCRRSASSPACRLRPAPTMAVLLLFAASAHGVVTITVDGTDFDSDRNAYVAQVTLTPSIWTNFSKNCSFVQGGTECPVAGDDAEGKPAQPGPQQGGSPPDDDVLLFSWGTQEPLSVTPGSGNNSWLRVNFGNGIDFGLNTVAFETLNNSSNLGPDLGPTPGTYDPPQGVGTMISYEMNNQILNPGNVNVHHVTDQRMDIHYWHDDTKTITKTVEDWFVAADQGTAESSATEYRIPPVPGTSPPGIARFTLDEDRRFFFTESGEATVNDPALPAGDQDKSVRLQDGDALLFQFYESDWNNDVLVEPNMPDAYYGSFEVIITPLASALSVQNDDGAEAGIDFGTVRAGDSSATEGLTARNAGASGTTLDNVKFADVLSGSKASYIVVDPATGPGPASLGTADTLARDYSAGGLAFGDVDGVTIGAGEAVQSVSADGVPDVTRAITATIKGPILGLGKTPNSTPATSDLSAWADYGSEIVIGDTSIDGDSFTKSLALANLFGDVDPADGNLTDLTFYSVGFGPSFDPTTSFFSIVGGLPSFGDDLDASTTGTPLQIDFDRAGDLATEWRATLYFLTDQNRPLNSCAGLNVEACLGDEIGSIWTFDIIVRAGAVPLPGGLALIALGLFSMAAVRRRRGAA
jgi:hypothetical protein